MEFKVFKAIVEVRQHFNADSLDLVLAGEYQFVAQKGIYQTGDIAIVIPEKSIVPPSIQEHFINYLKGPEKNRVGGIRLRGEISQGILLNRVEAEKILGKSLDEFEFDVDISELLSITKYEAYIPPSMAGIQKRYSGEHHYFDCVQYGSHAKEFQDDEIVIVTEKVHGSQINYIFDCVTGEENIGTKNQLQKDIVLEKDENNLYWKGAINSKLNEYCQYLKTKVGEDVTKIQIVGEVIPCQGGYSYGQVEPKVAAFNVTLYRSGNVESFFPVEIIYSWHLEVVPVLAIARYGEIKDKLRGLAEGMEQVSGKELHIREGVVVRPKIDRKSSRGTWLRLKIINPKYKETGEELS